MNAPWAAPLTQQERVILGRKLDRACKSFWAATLVTGKGRRSLCMLTLASAEASELHADTTGRAR